jgi:hypothetical protein
MNNDRRDFQYRLIAATVGLVVMLAFAWSPSPKFRPAPSD